MLSHVALNGGGTEKSALADLRSRKKIVDHRSQIVRQPIVYRSAESRLWLFQNLARKRIAHCFAKDVFRGGSELALQFEVWRNIPGDELRQFTIEKRHTHLDGRRHTHFVVIGQVQTSHKNLGVEVEHLVQKIGIADPIKGLAVAGGRIKSR